MTANPALKTKRGGDDACLYLPPCGGESDFPGLRSEASKSLEITREGVAMADIPLKVADNRALSPSLAKAKDLATPSPSFCFLSRKGREAATRYKPQPA